MAINLESNIENVLNIQTMLSIAYLNKVSTRFKEHL